MKTELWVRKGRKLSRKLSRHMRRPMSRKMSDRYHGYVSIRHRYVSFRRHHCIFFCGRMRRGHPYQDFLCAVPTYLGRGWVRVGMRQGRQGRGCLCDSLERLCWR